MVRKKNTEKGLHWRKLVDRQVGSGLSIRQYCAKEGISQPSFYAWRKRLRDRKRDHRRPPQSRRRTDGHDGDREFIPLQLLDSASMLEVIHPRGYRVRVSGEVNLTALRQLIRELPEEVMSLKMEQVEVKSYVGGLIKSFERKAA